MVNIQADNARSAVVQLRNTVRGRVIEADSAEYHQARRVFYNGFDRRPLAIVRAADAADVARVVSLAREARLPLAVRGGGHSPAGHCTVDNGIVLDMSAMKRLEIDATARSAWADAGLTAGEFTDAVGAHDLATGFGDAGSVGIAGITMSGGVGFLHRRYGLTIDNLLQAEIVTASGDLLNVDAESHPDLFWAIRGGGGNFGVVTRLRYRLHEVGSVLGGFMVLPITTNQIPELLNTAAESSDALSGVFGVLLAPPAPFLPPEVHGRLVMMVSLVHCGSPEEAEREVGRLRAIATPALDMVRRIPYAGVYHGAEPPQPPRVALHPTFVDDVDQATAQTIVDALHRSRAPMRVAQFRILGGAVSAVPRDATAFAHRHRRMMTIIAAMCSEPGQYAEHKAWADEFARQLPNGEPGAYVGFLDDEDNARVYDAYPAGTRERLAAVKAKYDPSNLFRLNQNIAPSTGQ